MRVESDRGRLLIDGRQQLIRSASLEYFRLPSRVEWRDRISKIAAAGFNCVSVAYPWSYHAASERSYDFEGCRDIALLHRMIEDAGLYLIARPGPYVGCDLAAGGLPGWLVADDRVPLRCQVAGAFSPAPEFMLHVSSWFGELCLRLRDCARLVLVALEQQYAVPLPMAWLASDWARLIARRLGSHALLRLWAHLSGATSLVPRKSGQSRLTSSNSYLQALCRSLREGGVSVPTTHAGFMGQPPQLDVDIAGVEDRRLDPTRRRESFVAELEALQHAAHSARPAAYLGLDAGISDGWGGVGFAECRQREAWFPVEGLVLGALGAGSSVVNVSRFSGGTSWGYLGTPASYTSYDCAAPIAEDGSLGPAYHALSRLNHWLREFDAELCVASHVETRREGMVFSWMRRSDRHLFRFVQSASPHPEDLAYADEPRGRLEPYETQLRVYSRHGELLSVSPAFREPAASRVRKPARQLPSLGDWSLLCDWSFSLAGAVLDPAFDDASWMRIPEARVRQGRLDFGSLGSPYGFVWYRGTFQGELERLELELRHAYSIWLNRELIAEGEPHTRLTSIGLAPLARERIGSLGALCSEGRNSLVVLVESLGQPDALSDACRQRSGLLRVDTGSTGVEWCCRPGLLRGEEGLAPTVGFEAVDRSETIEVSLPHSWSESACGVGLYETTFSVAEVDVESQPLAVRVDPSRGRANLYLNGLLLGRIWPERGPQNEFFIPRGMLRACPQENHLAIAVWKRSRGAALGRVRLVRSGA